ncbi:homing endonuclease [Terfezia boudieri ATCC MYA-4762]|uniref:Homing endonuclease n=1 Tax=Terfezia boudieri ATCC MYA-4762 TaxID=1051890 RepID=A0A3N4LIX7_9PEZI|nr:homing endonuclease [Terfezia boudieri ATCC MYA-4762]
MLRVVSIKTGWEVRAFFVMSLHKRDLALLMQIVSFLGVDYQLFKLVVEIMNSGEHLTPSGLHTILAIKASLNNGLSDELKAEYSDITPVQRPLVVSQEIKDPNWVAGFASGDGCFMVKVKKSSESKTGYFISLAFQLTQHSRDEQLMKSFGEFFGCGKYYDTKGIEGGNFIIIPFFENYPIVGVKYLDYVDLCKVAEIMKINGHLTPEGLDQIRIIKGGANKGRQG